VSRAVLLALALAAGAGCPSTDPLAAQCVVNSDCSGVLVCRDGTCRAPCTEDKDCERGESCVDTACAASPLRDAGGDSDAVADAAATDASAADEECLASIASIARVGDTDCGADDVLCLDFGYTHVWAEGYELGEADGVDTKPYEWVPGELPSPLRLFDHREGCGGVGPLFGDGVRSPPGSISPGPHELILRVAAPGPHQVVLYVRSNGVVAMDVSDAVAGGPLTAVRTRAGEAHALERTFAATEDGELRLRFLAKGSAGIAVNGLRVARLD
jgi:hypothetical protein